MGGYVGKTIANLPLVAAIATPIAAIPALCQRQSISELLQMGVRGLDLRVGLHEGEIYICHTVVCDLTLSSALQQVADFLKEQPEEVVVVLIKRDWDHRDFDTTANWEELQAIVQSVLGDFVLQSHKQLRQPVNELCVRGKRAAVVIQTPSDVEVVSGIKSGNHCLLTSWRDATRSVEGLLEVLQEWRTNGWIEPEPGKLKLMEVALPGLPSWYAPKAMEAFRSFLEEAAFGVGAN